MDMSNERNNIELEEVLKDWTSTSIGRRSFLASVPALLTACATVEQTRYREGDNTGQATALSVADEVRMAKSVRGEMLEQYPPVRDITLQSYVARIGTRVVQANSLQGRPYNYTFQVVATTQVNAFALPAGPVFITAPLIAMADSEAELAGVIGHEIGHIRARHTAERIYRQERAKGKSVAYLLGGGLVGGILGYGLGKVVCRKRDYNCRSSVMQLGAAAGAGGAAIISKFGFMAHSREDELEADRVGFKTSVAAGYDKNHVGKFYEKLLGMEQRAKSPSKSGMVASFTDALSTHPPSRQRVQQMQEMAREARFTGNGKISSNEFDDMRLKALDYSERK